MADANRAADDRADDEAKDAADGRPTTRPALPKRRSSAYINITEGDNQRSDKDGEPGFLMKLSVKRRRPVCCCLVLTNVFWIVLTLILASLGLDPINTDNLSEVGLVLPDDVYQQRANAYATGKDRADFALAGGKCPRQDVADPISFHMMRGDFERESRGNAFTQNGLRELRDREQQVMTHKGWNDRCNTIYATDFKGGCTPWASLELPTAGGGAAPTYLQTDANGCMVPFSPVFLFAKYGDPDFEDVAGTAARIEATSATDWQSLLDMLHKDFTFENLRSKHLTTTIYAGTPRQNASRYVDDATYQLLRNGARISYYSDSDREDESEHLTNWITRELQSKFERNFEKGSWPTTFNFYGYDAVNDQVTADLTLIVFSILFVFLYMAFYTGSFFIASLGMMQIFTSFAGANLLYRYCWPNAYGLGYNYFTLFCALALFIIMGIGADDIFVYWDTWTASKEVPYKTEAHRLKHAWSHAAGAMAVTSATTILSFLSNLGSPFIGVVTFGVFSALLVFVNYCAVTTLFPLVVLVYDKHVAQLLPCVGQASAAMGRACAGLWAKCRGKPPPDPDATPEEKAPWFSRVYAPWLMKHRRLIIGAHVAVWCVAVYFASTLQVTPFKAYELLPETSNFYQYNFIDEEWTPKSSNPLNVHVLYGLKHRQPLHWNGATDRFVSGDSGKPRFDAAFDLDPGGAQMQLIRVAEELAFDPRSGLKVDTTFGINPQLDSSNTGSFLDTIGAGQSASVQSAYGVQSLLHALRQWENVSVAIDAAAGEYASELTNRTCKPCFPLFTIDPPPASLPGPYLVNPATNTVPFFSLEGGAPLRDGCNCVGFFPLPENVCLFETADVADGTRYKCSSPDYNVAEELSKFFQPETGPDLSWWEDYIFFLGLSDGAFDRTAMYDIQVQSTLRASEGDYKVGLRMADTWDKWMDNQNKRQDLNPLKVMVYVPGSEGWVVASLMKGSGIENMLISLALAWVVLTYSTGNYITSTMATCTIGMIATIVLAFLNIVGWGLGVLESILIVIVIGFSVDYTVHLADSFMQSHSMDREGKVTDALTHTGMSVLSGAISTILASIPMLFTQIIFFFKFGVFILLTIVLSLLFSLGFFAALLSEVGPIGTRGQVVQLYAGCVKRAQAEMDEKEEEQRLFDSKRASQRRGRSGDGGDASTAPPPPLPEDVPATVTHTEGGTSVVVDL